MHITGNWRPLVFLSYSTTPKPHIHTNKKYRLATLASLSRVWHHPQQRAWRMISSSNFSTKIGAVLKLEKQHNPSRSSLQQQCRVRASGLSCCLAPHLEIQTGSLFGRVVKTTGPGYGTSDRNLATKFFFSFCCSAFATFTWQIHIRFGWIFFTLTDFFLFLYVVPTSFTKGRSSKWRPSPQWRSTAWSTPSASQ